MGQNTCSVTLTGNLTRDPKFFSDVPLCAFDVAVNSSVKEAGEWIEHTSYLRVVSFGRLAERCAGSLAKGQKVALRLEPDLNHTWRTARAGLPYLLTFAAQQFPIVGGDRNVN